MWWQPPRLLSLSISPLSLLISQNVASVSGYICNTEPKCNIKYEFFFLKVLEFWAMGVWPMNSIYHFLGQGRISLIDIPTVNLCYSDLAILVLKCWEPNGGVMVNWTGQFFGKFCTVFLSKMKGLVSIPMYEYQVP